MWESKQAEGWVPLCVCSKLLRLREAHGALLLRHLPPVGRRAGAFDLPLPLLQPVPPGARAWPRCLPLHGLQHLHEPR